MAIERKVILSTLADNKQLVLPTTASISGYDLNTGNLIYFNTGSNQWSTQETISGSSGIFNDLTASNLRLTGTPGSIVNEVGPLLISSSLGITTSGSIIFSGSRSDLGTEQTSVLVNGDMFVSGGLGTNDYIQLKPVGSLRIPTNTTSSYIYTSGSTNDLYFTQYSGPYTNTTRLRWLEGSLSTGLLNGGILSTVNGTTTFSVTSGSGIIVDFNASTTTDPYPTVKKITWPLSSSIPLYYSGSAQITYVGIDTNGQVVQRTSPFSGIDYQDYISLGRVLHQTNAVSNGTITSPFVSYGQSTWNADFNRAFGPLKISGHTLAPSGSGITLAITKSAGDSYVEGRNYTTDPNSPSLILGSVEGAQLSSKIFRIYSDTSGTPTILNNGNLGYTDIEPGKYNPGNLGVTSSVGSGKFTIQRVFWFPNSVNKAFFVYYGTTEYATLDVAQSSIPTDFFVEGANTAGAAILVAYLIVAYNATNLNSSTQARILQAGLFRNNGIGGGGGGATTPGGSDTYVQFNNNGTFGGDADLTFNTTTNTLSTTNIQVSGIVGASGSVTLGDAASDVITVTGQLTASQGISASNNISTAGSLLVQGTTQITGSLIASRITGSLSGTVVGNPFIVAGSGITTNYNSLGQWEITGSGGGFTASQLVALTQATNTELNDDSLAYVVIDPSGTPISRKSTIARMGTLPESYLEMVGLHQTIGIPSSGNYTIGVRFYPARASQECTGVRVYWRGTSSVTLKLGLYEVGVAGILASGNVTTTTTPGIYTVTFGGAVALNPKKQYIASCYETSGSVFLSYVGNLTILAPPLRFRDYHITDSYYYEAGDINPTLPYVGYVVELEPLISG